MEETWKEHARTLEELLHLDLKPIAVTFTNDPFDVDKERIVSLCGAIKSAGRGESFVIDAETSGCPGGSWHCGLTEPLSGEGWRFIQDFLTRGEKLTHSIATFERMMKLTDPPPTGLSERILIGPMGDAPVRPDIALFLSNPEQACRLITLDQYWDGIPPRIELAGSLCHSAIAYPIVTGRTNLSLGDWTARRMTGFSKDIVFVSVPFERIHNLVSAIPECSAGTAELELPPGFEREAPK